MSGLFDRWRKAGAATPDLQPLPAVGLQIWLDDLAQVMQLAGPLRTLLALPARNATRLHDYLEHHSCLVIEGSPDAWQGGPLDLDFHTVTGSPLRTRGWIQRHGQAWLLQLFDIGDLVRERRWDRQRPLLGEIGHALRECGTQRLAQVAAEQLQLLAEQWQAASLRLMLHEPSGWRHYVSSDADWPWPDDSRLHRWLVRLAPDVQQIRDDPPLMAECGGTSLYFVPYCLGHEVQAWLVCADVAKLPEADVASALARTLIEPLLVRLLGQRLGQQSGLLDELQQQLGVVR